MNLLIKGGTLILKNKTSWKEVLADIRIAQGKIIEVEKKLSPRSHEKTLPAKGLHILPGIIDTQVHFREPGKTEYKETFYTGSKAAIRGGITGVFDMPNTSPSLVNERIFIEKLKKAEGNFWCNYAFYAGASPNNTDKLAELEQHPHCCGIKMFIGSSTGDLLVWKDQDIETVFKKSFRRMAIHSEDEARLQERKLLYKKGDTVHTHPFLRDELSAIISTKKVLQFSQKWNRLTHILHITTAQELELIAEAKKTNPYLSCECLPQHLFLNAPDCYDNLGSLVQMNPPIRTQEHQKALWKAIENNVVEIIASDHAPHLLSEKAQDYPNSPSGMPGVQTILPLLLNAVCEKKISLFQVVKLMCENPVKLFGIKNKGQIAPGFDADLTVVDLNKPYTIRNQDMEYLCGWTPFDETKLKASIFGTIISGHPSYWEGQIQGTPQGSPYNFKNT